MPCGRTEDQFTKIGAAFAIHLAELTLTPLGRMATSAFFLLPAGWE